VAVSLWLFFWSLSGYLTRGCFSLCRVPFSPPLQNFIKLYITSPGSSVLHLDFTLGSLNELIVALHQVYLSCSVMLKCQMSGE
jgi:hypothetical protein